MFYCMFYFTCDRSLTKLFHGYLICCSRRPRPLSSDVYAIPADSCYDIAIIPNSDVRARTRGYCEPTSHVQERTKVATDH